MWCVMEFPVIWRLAQPQWHVRTGPQDMVFEDTESWVCVFRSQPLVHITHASACQKALIPTAMPELYCSPGVRGQGSVDLKVSSAG